MKKFAAACLSMVAVSSYAQERFGISNSNYAGLNGVWLNPSSLVDSRVFIDVHFAGVGGFLHNNYVYLPNERVWGLGKRLNETTQLGFRNNSANKNGFLDLMAMGPGASLSVGKNAFALYSGVRSYTHLNNVPDQLVDILRNGYTWRPEYAGAQNWRRASFKQMTWAEVGGTYGRILKQDRVHQWQGGLTVKRLWGINATMASMQQLDFTVVDSTQVTLQRFNGNYAYTSNPGWNQGRGWAADLGLTYKRSLNDENYDYYTPHQGAYKCEPMDYKFKVGFSILDVGRINFDRGAVYRGYNRDFTADDNTDAVQLQPGMSATAAAQEIFTAGNATTTATSFKAWMPTAASLQFDYNFENYFYLNVSSTQRLGRNTVLGVPRPNVTALTPRYERKNFEIAMPVSLYEYRYPMVGMMVRFNGIIIGTDNLGPLIFRHDIYRADIYAHFKWSIFRNCDEKIPRSNDNSPRPQRVGTGKSKIPSKSTPKGKNRKLRQKKRRLKKKTLACPDFKAG